MGLAISSNLPPLSSPLELAKFFHETYERLAPKFGYETREATKVFDPTTANAILMVAVCGEVMDAVRAYGEARAAAEREVCAKQMERLGQHELAHCLRNYQGTTEESSGVAAIRARGET